MKESIYGYGRYSGRVIPPANVFLVLLTLAASVFFGCAKIQSPPGGPEDKTPPEVVSTTPEPGAVNVDRLAPVRIEFSEPVIKDKIGEAIYISPPPPTDPKFGWEKNAVLIKWQDSLAANMTYLVTVAARVTDRRRNRLAGPFVLAFSTGPAIDSGVITGIVFDGEKPAADAEVLLFILPLDSGKAIFNSPDYITESGPDGAYSFSYLSAGSYRAVAASDKNKNRRLDIGEKAGVGAFDAQLSARDHRSAPLYLYLRDVDTARFELVRCRVNPDRILRVEFSHPVDSMSLYTAGWSIKAVTEADELQVGLFDVDLQDDKIVRFLLEGARVGVSYRLTVSRLADKRGWIVDSLWHTAQFFWPAAADTTLPKVVLSSPAHKDTRVDYRCEIGVWFSEPVDTAQLREGFLLADSSGLRVYGSIAWPKPWEMTFTPDSDLAGNVKYMMVLDSSSVVDCAGNTAEERWAASFTTIEPSVFGGVAGSLSVSREEWFDQSIILEFVPSGKKLSPVAEVLTGPAPFAYELPAGIYTLRAFVDLNENRRFDCGSVLPYTPAEPRFFFPDTVEVRARFVTEAVNLTVP